LTGYLAEAQIEARAAELWRRHGLRPDFDVERLLDELELGLVWERIDDRGEEGRVLGQLIPAQQLVVLNERHLTLMESRGGALRRFTVGHEVAHWILHARGSGLGSSSLFDGTRVLCRDGSRESIERQADMFSAALLMHPNSLREALPVPPWRGWPPVYRLAEAFGVNVTPMAIRLERLGWMHRDAEGVPLSGRAREPDQSTLFD
jgi:Zn-dependent peptidase ImmA (M78 family)